MGMRFFPCREAKMPADPVDSEEIFLLKVPGPEVIWDAPVLEETSEKDCTATVVERAFITNSVRCSLLVFTFSIYLKSLLSL
jgi:hypothetical protein